MAKDAIVEDLLREAASGLRGCLCPEGLHACSASLEELLELAEEHQLRQRTHLLNRLEKWILDAQAAGRGRCLRGVRELTLQAFGSSVMGISSRGGDLDISLEGSLQDRRVSNSGHLTDADRRFRGDLLGEVHQTLQRGGHFRSGKSTQLVRTAKVPVSRFVEAETGIHCDLSIGNSIGVFKSQILGEVIQIDKRVRDLVVLVKKWAKANEINDPSMGTFNSYCLTLLVISFVQTREPPLLPPFQTMFPDLRKTIRQHGARTGCPSLLSEIGRFKEMARVWCAKKDREKNEQALFELLLEFLVSMSLLVTHSQLMNYTAEGGNSSGLWPTAAPWEGGFASIRWDCRAIHKYHFFVEDPFEAQDNCARTLTTQDWWYVCKLLQETAEEVQNFRNASAGEKSWQWANLSNTIFGKRLSASLPRGSGGGQDVDALLSAHRKALFAHLNRFKLSDRKYIVFSKSWCSASVMKIMTTAIQEVGLHIGKGPNHKLMISKEDDAKVDLAELAVQGTLRGDKQQAAVDPRQCVVKQRITEFLKCNLRVHIFRTRKFRPEVKAWICGVMENLDMHTEWLGDGNLRIEVPASMDRPAVQARLAAELAIPWRLGGSNGRGSFEQLGKPQDTEDTEDTEDALDNTKWPAGFEDCEEDGLDEEEEDTEHNFGDDSDEHVEEGNCTDSQKFVLDLEDRMPGQHLDSYPERTLPSVSGMCCKSQPADNAVVRLVPNLDNSVGATIAVERTAQENQQRSVLQEGETTVDPDEATCARTEAKEWSLGSVTGMVYQPVHVELEWNGDAVKVKVSMRHGAAQTQPASEATERKLLPCSEAVQSHLQTTRTKGTSELRCLIGSTTSQAKPVEGMEIVVDESGRLAAPSDSSPCTKGSNKDAKMNAEILRGVFDDLSEGLQAFKQSQNFDILIDPTPYVVPVGWVRQQIRDIANSLNLELENPLTAKGQMDVRVFRRGAGTDSDGEDDFNPQMQRDTQRAVRNSMDENSKVQKGGRRRLADMQANVSSNMYQQRLARSENHLLGCFNWVKKLNKANGRKFWAAGYTRNVQKLICQRAEENGLRAAMMDGSIWIGTGPEDEQDKPLPQTGQWEHGWNVDSLNNEIIAGIHNHLLERLQEMKQQGIVEVTINSRGFIMQPQWVLEQTESIAEHLGGIRVDELGGIMRVLNLEAVRRRPRNSVPHNIPHGSAPAGAHASKMLPRSVQMYPGTYHSSQRERYAGNAVQMPRSGMGPFLNSVLEPPDAAHHQGSPARTCGPSGWTEQAGRPFSRHSARSSVNQRQGAPGPMVQVQGVHPGNDTAGTANDLRGSGGSYRHKRDGRECVSRGGRGARGRRGGRGAKGSSTGRNSGKAKDQSP